MTTLEYRFPAHRYHATPWGSHVNEGLVEWPPSPFRLLRALVATGFSRFGWTSIDGTARELLELLARHPPSYSVPESVGAHSRHYMPPYRGNTTKVIDAFLRLPDQCTLFVHFPIELPTSCRELLRSLLRAQPYLGRAEAWVEACLAEEKPEGLVWIEPGLQQPDRGYERFELLSPDDPSTYLSWRQDFVEAQLVRREREEAAKAEAKGKSFKGLTKKDREKLDALVPKSVVDAMLQDTATLRKEGWNQPPGTRWVGYYRRIERPLSAAAWIGSHEGSGPNAAALFALRSETRTVDLLPRMQSALRRMEIVHDALVNGSDLDGRGPSLCFAGKRDGLPLKGHLHASILPLSLACSRETFDHILVFSPMGFDDGAQRALEGLRALYSADLPKLFVTLIARAPIMDLAGDLPAFRASTVLASSTPFVPARFLKNGGQNTLLEHVQSELTHRGLPRALKIEIEVEPARVHRESTVFRDATAVRVGKQPDDVRILADDGVTLERPSLRFRHYRRVRQDRRPPAALGLSLRLTFEEPVAGPVSLGYGSHFGLGLFEACRQRG